MIDVDTLDDVELRVALSRRGVPTAEARWLVDNRRAADAAAAIRLILDRPER